MAYPRDGAASRIDGRQSADAGTPHDQPTRKLAGDHKGTGLPGQNLSATKN